MSPLWSAFKIIHLKQNVRTGPNQQQFADWLLKLGDGKLEHDEDGKITIPEINISNGDLIMETFEYKLTNPTDPSLQHRVILSPKNEDVFQLNRSILSQLPGEERTYKSIDTAECHTDENITNYPTEFLNKLTPTGFPPHDLRLKIGSIIMLLRNLNIDKGLCNGTRLIASDLKDHVLLCTVLSGSKAGHHTFIPRINLISSDPFLPVTLCRRQFPVKLAYAMTINKAQGQTFEKVGLYLPNPIFSHGQLYVAFSRVKTPDSIKVLTTDRESKTKNIVYTDILQ